MNSILQKKKRKQESISESSTAASLKPPTWNVPSVHLPAPGYLVRAVLCDAGKVCLQLGRHFLEYIKPPARQKER